MTYDKTLVNRIRERLAVLPMVEEKEMMGSLIFMVNDKMCVGATKNGMMIRIDPEIHETLLEMNGCRTMEFTKGPLKGYLIIDDTGMRTPKEFEYWINLALEFNDKAKSSKKKKTSGVRSPQ